MDTDIIHVGVNTSPCNTASCTLLKAWLWYVGNANTVHLALFWQFKPCFMFKQMKYFVAFTQKHLFC